MLQRIVCGRSMPENRLPDRPLFAIGGGDRQRGELQEDIVSQVLGRQVVLAVAILLRTCLRPRCVVVPDPESEACVQRPVAGSLAVDEPTEQYFENVAIE